MPSTTPSSSTSAGVLFHDDFAAGPGRWQPRPLGGRPAGDGLETTGPEGLVVVPTATHPDTGEPAFAEPLGPGPDLRWALLVDHTSSAGFPGFDVPGTGALQAGDVPGAGDGVGLVVEAELSVQCFGMGDDAGAEVRHGAAGLVTLDRESGVVCDVLLTGTAVFAVYERLPRPDVPGAVFSYAVPAGHRAPERWHRARIAYEAVGVIRWWVDDRLVLEVDRPGRRRGGEHRQRDNGLADDDAVPRQVVPGLGLLAGEVRGQGVRLAARHVTVSHR